MDFFYNHTSLKIEDRGAATLAMKRTGHAVLSFSTKVDGKFVVDTTDFPPGEYFLQFTAADGAVVATDKIVCKQNLAFADADFDPRSDAEKTVDAIDAMLAGRATAQQRRIQLGDKSIEYSTFDELMKWRTHFVRVVRKERGQVPAARRQLFNMK